MRRRDFLGLIGTAAALPQAALAQAARMPRVVYLAPPEIPERPEAFARGLADQGYIDGKTVTLEFFRAPSLDALPAFAAMAVASRPDVIFAVTTGAAQAARVATPTIPIVFTIVTDPITSGLVTNLARPGGNITGNSLVSRDLIGKQVSILKDILPSLSRLAVLNVPTEVIAPLYQEPIRTASRALGIEPVFVDFVDGPDLAGQFKRLTDAGAQAALLERWNYLTASGNRDVVFDLLLRAKLPVMSSDVVEGGATPFIGVVSYGPNTLGMIRRATTFVDAILKGAKPGDLPVEQPTAFDFAVNLDTARKIGLSILPSIVAQATLVVDEDWRATKVAK